MLNKLEEIYRVRAEADLIYTEAEVDTALERMAHSIAALLGDKNPLLLAVLNGGIVVTARLLTQLQFPLELDTVFVSRYWGTLQGNELRWLHRPGEKVRGRSVLVIDDILDEGITLAEIKKTLLEEGASDVYTAVLIEKDLEREKPHRADFIGLTAPNRYLFGYGMDYKGYWRNAPGIFACREE